MRGLTVPSSKYFFNYFKEDQLQDCDFFKTLSRRVKAVRKEPKSKIMRVASHKSSLPDDGGRASPETLPY